MPWLGHSTIGIKDHGDFMTGTGVGEGVGITIIDTINDGHEKTCFVEIEQVTVDRQECLLWFFIALGFNPEQSAELGHEHGSRDWDGIFSG